MCVRMYILNSFKMPQQNNDVNIIITAILRMRETKTERLFAQDHITVK